MKISSLFFAHPQKRVPCPLQVTTEIHAHAKAEGADGASLSVVVYELRWACPHCSDSILGRDLAARDTFHAIKASRLPRPINMIQVYTSCLYWHAVARPELPLNTPLSLCASSFVGGQAVQSAL